MTLGYIKGRGVPETEKKGVINRAKIQNLKIFCIDKV